MRRRALVRKAARRNGRQTEAQVEAAVRDFLYEAARALAAGDTVSFYPLGELYPIELSEDGRRKRRGVRFLPSSYMIGLMGRHRPIDAEAVAAGRIRIGELVALRG